MNFTEQLRHLPPVTHLAAIELLDASGQPVGRIHNRPGQVGSLTVYAALARQHGGVITPTAAAQGLDWFCEHVASAREHPGSHPNIDRLLAWAAGTQTYSVRLIPA